MTLRSKNKWFAGRNGSDAGQARFTPVPERANNLTHRPIDLIGGLRRFDTALSDDFPYEIRFLHAPKE
jgi:hypothetical protein